MRIPLDGCRFRVREEGSREALPVVFLHAFPFTSRMWRPQVEELGGRFRTMAFDQRGFGESEAEEGPYTMECLVDDLIGLLDALEVERAVLCGLSMGGYVVLRAVEREPGRVRALVLCDTRSEADSDEGKLRRAEAIRTVRREGVAAFAEGFLPQALGPSTLRERPAIVQEARAIIESNASEAICRAQAAMATRTDTTAALAGVGVPALVMVGEEDALTPPRTATELAGRIPGAELRVLPGAGHLSALENPEAFNAGLRAFLERVGAEE